MKQQESNEIYLIFLFKKAISAIYYLFSKWWIIFLVTIVFGLLGVLYAWMQKPSFTAELVFSSEAGEEGSLGGYAGLAAQFGFDIGGSVGGAFEGDNLMELLRSWKIIEKTLLSDAKDFGNGSLMINVYLHNHELNTKWPQDKKLSKIHFEKNPSAPNRLRDSVLKAVYKSLVDEQLSINKKDKKLNYIVVRMKDINEVYAKDFVETLVNNAADYYVEYKSKKARKNFELVSRLTDSVKALLYGNIENFASSTDLNVNPLRQVVRTGSQKIQVNAQANTALYTELLKQLGLSQITLQKETPLIQIIDQPVLPLKNEKKGRFFTGLVFSFVGFAVISVFLLLFRWVNREFRVSKSVESETELK